MYSMMESIYSMIGTNNCPDHGVNRLYKSITRQTSIIYMYSKTCVKRPLKNRQNKDLNDKW